MFCPYSLRVPDLILSFIYCSVCFSSGFFQVLKGLPTLQALDRHWIYSNSDQDKLVTKNEWMNFLFFYYFYNKQGYKCMSDFSCILIQITKVCFPAFL